MRVNISNLFCKIKRRKNKSSFTLVELLATIAIIAVLTTIAGVFVSAYINWSQSLADQRTLTTLNDALNRYKCEGGSLSALTAGAPISHIISKLSSTISWNGLKHFVMNRGSTYPSRSLAITGSGRNFLFTRYNSYNGPGGLSGGGPAPFGAGNGYISGAPGTSFNFISAATSSNYATFIVDGGSPQIIPSNLSSDFENYVADLGTGTNVVFYSSDASGNPQGDFLALDMQTVFASSLNISGLPKLTYLDCSMNSALLQLDVSGLKDLNLLNCNGDVFLSNLNISGCSSLNLGSIIVSSTQLSTYNVSGTPLAASTSFINSFFDDPVALPSFGSGTHNLYLGTGAPTATDANANAKHWTVYRTNG